MSFHPIKLFCCDLNWTMQDEPFRHCPPSAPQDWGDEGSALCLEYRVGDEGSALCLEFRGMKSQPCV